MYSHIAAPKKRIVMTYGSPQSRPGWPVLVAIIVATIVAAMIGTVASLQAPEFYMMLNAPSWAPPPWLFGPVWTVLYVMMALAAWLVVRERRRSSALPELMLYGVQLALNALWTWLFFRWHQGAAAFAEITLLLILVALTAVAFGRIRSLAGVLMLPYLGWVGFATVLTFSLWQRNPGVL
jgi:tryptophan-rich sensory protein